MGMSYIGVATITVRRKYARNKNAFYAGHGPLEPTVDDKRFEKMIDDDAFTAIVKSNLEGWQVVFSAEVPPIIESPEKLRTGPDIMVDVDLHDAKRSAYMKKFPIETPCQHVYHTTVDGQEATVLLRIFP